jgi:hypothetical protein
MLNAEAQETLSEIAGLRVESAQDECAQRRNSAMRIATKGLGLLVCVLAAAMASQGWGQAAGQGSGQGQDQGTYQGVSHPPANDSITTSTPQEAKPSAGQPMAPLRSQQQANPAYSQPQQRMAAVPMADARDGTDDGLVGVAPNARDQRLAMRSADPDGDIVHPEALRPGMLAEGTMIRVRLIDRLSTVTSEKGEAFRTRVATDVLRDGQVLIPAGSEIDGRVAEVSKGHTGGYGTMRLQPEMVILPDGSRLRMSADVTSTPGSHTRVIGEGTIRPDSRLKKDGIEYGGAVGAGVVTGAIVGGPVGAAAGGLVGAGVITVHLLVDHPQATLEEGTSLMFMLTQPLDLVREGGMRQGAVREGASTY